MIRPREKRQDLQLLSAVKQEPRESERLEREGPEPARNHERFGESVGGRPRRQSRQGPGEEEDRPGTRAVGSLQSLVDRREPERRRDRHAQPRESRGGTGPPLHQGIEREEEPAGGGARHDEERAEQWGGEGFSLRHGQL